MILLALSFIAGILTILAPCTLPILPLMVGSSIVGGGESKTTNFRKAFTIATSLGASIVAFTFILKFGTTFAMVPPSIWAIISGTIIIFFGLITIFPNLWENIPGISKLNIGSNKLLGIGYQKKSFLGDCLIGAALGPVFATCSPTYFLILASVLPQSFIMGFIDVVAYAVGLSGMVLLVAILGQKIVARLGLLADPNGWFKKILGLIFVLLGLGIIFGFDKVVENKLLNSGIFDITKVEQALLLLGTQYENQNKNFGGQISRPRGKVAPEIAQPSYFINTNGQPITISQFKGKKVVLVDFWTYSCINCQRTLPYLVAWYAKYKDQGLEIVSIHTPEFAFEKVPANVEAAVKKFGIEYPVVMDNNYGTWNAFNNNVWPRKYLIDENGQIIYDHIGEGKYDETEKAIQNALNVLHKVNGETVSVPKDMVAPSNVVAPEPGKVRSPEIYFGAARNDRLANGEQFTDGVQKMQIPTDSSSISGNRLYLGGTWKINEEFAEGQGPSAIVFKYNAKNVYMVASSDVPITLHIYIDGKKSKDLEVSSNVLYTLVEGAGYGEHTIRIEADKAGLKAYTFTFG